MHRLHPLLVPVILLALFQSCAGRAVRQVESGGPGTETIAIVGTNDLHGALLPLRFQSLASAGEPSVAYEAGGAAMLASYLRALREEWGGNMLWLDAGDALTGTLESEVDQGASMVAFLNQNGLDAAAVGENDLRLEALQARVSEARFPYLAVNLRDSVTGKPAELPGALPSRILKAGGLNIGVIGIAGGRSAVQPARAAERAFLGGKLRAGPAPDAVAAEAKRLRDSGAHLVIGLAHAGAACEPGSAPVSHFIRKPSDPLGACS
ncbi:MAG TPA: hypothetical protein VM598_00790, partial [Bdellovibrionota bacterium]|nr:hypothetical protein [Bdellovibrionota bacterium]